MSIVHGSRQEKKVDIYLIPSIGADPRETWTREPNIDKTRRLDYAIIDEQIDAAVYLYDHLEEEERGLEIPSSGGRLTEKQERIVKAYGATERALAAYNVESWADRLLEVLQNHRQRRKVPKYQPILFICHGTGGTVLKKALTKKAAQEPSAVANNVLSITFFGCPHHGSTVISNDTYVAAVQEKLCLKWPMSRTLREDFRLRGENEDLELINHRFALFTSGIKLYNYAEKTDSYLPVLVSSADGERKLIARECIVDSRSGKLSTPQLPVEDELFMQVDTDHVGLPRFAGLEAQFRFYMKELKELINEHSEEDTKSFQKLHHDIMTTVKVHVTKFYGEKNAMRILLSEPSLKDFLEWGPERAIENRIEGRDKEVAVLNDEDQLHLNGSGGMSGQVPTFLVEIFDQGSSGSRKSSRSSSLEPPSRSIPPNIHTTRPPFQMPATADSESNPHTTLSVGASEQRKAVHFGSQLGPQEFEDRDRIKEPQKSSPFQLPDKFTLGFRWVHAPFTHPGWVHHILGAVSEEKNNMQLHQSLLSEPIWMSQHNQSRHASPHAMFVRPVTKCLLPGDGPDNNTDIPNAVSSAVDHEQIAFYMPYLHWDSFQNMKERAMVIEERRITKQIRFVPFQIADSRSTEHKLIWRYLSTNQPLHCRRTLDQYGYPALRKTAVRDRDQIMEKRTNPEKLRRGVGNVELNQASRERSSFASSEVPHVAKVLMVDQLWLWVVDKGTVVTFFPGRENDNHIGFSRDGDLRSLIYQDINGDYANPCNNPYDFAALAIRHAVRAMIAKTADNDLQVFRIFEEYISILTEKQNESYKEFSRHQITSLKSINADPSKHIDNHEDLNNLIELRDIEDELKTLEKLLKDQHTCVDSLLTQYKDAGLDKKSSDFQGIKFLQDTLNFLEEHESQIGNMRESTQAATTAYKDLLDMKQKHATVIEARLAGERNKVAADQSKAVMIFTVFTIIFLPLSFFAGVFGMNVREWNSGPGGSSSDSSSGSAGGNAGNNFVQLWLILLLMLLVSAAVIFIALLAAFRAPRRWARLALRWLAKPFVHEARPGSDIGSSNRAQGRWTFSFPWKRSRATTGSPAKPDGDLEMSLFNGLAGKQAEGGTSKRQSLAMLSRSHTMHELLDKIERGQEVQTGPRGVGWYRSRSPVG